MAVVQLFKVKMRKTLLRVNLRENLRKFDGKFKILFKNNLDYMFM